MVDEMIKWFVDILKPPYYKKMINAEVTHFTILIPIGEYINEGMVNLEALIEQQVEKATIRNGKEADVHVIDKVPEGSRGVTSTYTTLNAPPY